MASPRKGLEGSGDRNRLYGSSDTALLLAPSGTSSTSVVPFPAGLVTWSVPPSAVGLFETARATPADTESRIADSAELVAAIANAEARTELTASRVRVLAAA
jgi:hypothetical protein